MAKINLTYAAFQQFSEIFKKSNLFDFQFISYLLQKNPWETILPVVAGIYLRLHLDCKLDSDF